MVFEIYREKMSIPKIMLPFIFIYTMVYKSFIASLEREVFWDTTILLLMRILVVLFI